MKRTLTEELEEFFDIWDATAVTKMIGIVYELHRIFDVDISHETIEKFDEENDEQHAKRIEMIVNAQNKRLAEAAYLISWFAEFYTGKLVNTNVKFKGLWQRMEKVANGMD